MWPVRPFENSPMTFSAYLFDYNGVLVDDEQVHWAAFAEVLRPMGIELSQTDYWEKYLGFDDFGAFRAALNAHGRAAPDAEVRRLVALKKPTYLRMAETQLKGFEGAGTLLRRLAEAGAIIGIVSGALRDEIELGLQVLDARSAVEFIVAAEDTRESKPDPEGYLIGKAQLIAKAGSDIVRATLVIEDSMAGIEAALGAGFPCLSVAHSYDEAQLKQAGAVRVAKRLADVTPEFLRQLAQELGK